MLVDALPTFITDNLCYNPWLHSNTPDVYLSQGGIVDPSVWSRLEHAKNNRSFKRPQSTSAIPRRKSYAGNKHRSGDSMHNRKLTYAGLENNHSPFKT